ncbi:MAG: hypothetical protein C4K49_05055 [Candidatus Thorarchaeota archaeon]|nr:MAG: hypothetical protein C4K49_05055 [Candidatus Thorarchaeota archaeon]
MKLQIEGQSIPYPMLVLRGRLRLCGLSQTDAEKIIERTVSSFGGADPTDNQMTEALRNRLKLKRSVLDAFDLIVERESLRSASPPLPPTVLVLEGASATGKSMLGIAMTYSLVATRAIGTDTVRQVLRTVHSQKDHPELFCHTYQAHKYKQAGPEELDPIVRGYLAQCELIQPVVRRLVERVLTEGADAVVEGVHVIPGAMRDLGLGVIEVLVDPPADTHRAMFMTKYAAAKLKTVTDDPRVREAEFAATRMIQDYLVEQARGTGIHIVELSDYDRAEKDICNIVIQSVRDMIRTRENK